MIELQVETDVQRPAPQVYEFVITNYMKNHPRWDGRVVRSELNGDGELAVGATGVEVRKEMGRENTFNFRVTELTADHLTFEANGSGGVAFGAVWAVTPSGEGSRVTMTFHLGMGGVMLLFEPLMKGAVRKDMRKAGQRIKELVEAP